MRRETIFSRVWGALIVPGAAAFIAGCATGPASFEGDVLTDSRGMTLYLFDKDTAGPGRSVFNGGCALYWPPLATGAY